MATSPDCLVWWLRVRTVCSDSYESGLSGVVAKSPDCLAWSLWVQTVWPDSYDCRLSSLLATSPDSLAWPTRTGRNLAGMPVTYPPPPPTWRQAPDCKIWIVFKIILQNCFCKPVNRSPILSERCVKLWIFFSLSLTLPCSPVLCTNRYRICYFPFVMVRIIFFPVFFQDGLFSRFPSGPYFRVFLQKGLFSRFLSGLLYFRVFIQDGQFSRFHSGQLIFPFSFRRAYSRFPSERLFSRFPSGLYFPVFLQDYLFSRFHSGRLIFSFLLRYSLISQFDLKEIGWNKLSTYWWGLLDEINPRWSCSFCSLGQIVGENSTVLQTDSHDRKQMLDLNITFFFSGRTW